MMVDQSRKRDLQLFRALHDACGTDRNTKQQHIIQNGISTWVFKIFMSAERKSEAENEEDLCRDQRKWSPFMPIFSTTLIPAHADMTLFQMTFLLNVKLR